MSPEIPFFAEQTPIFQQGQLLPPGLGTDAPFEDYDDLIQHISADDLAEWLEEDQEDLDTKYVKSMVGTEEFLIDDLLKPDGGSSSRNQIKKRRRDDYTSTRKMARRMSFDDQSSCTDYASNISSSSRTSSCSASKEHLRTVDNKPVFTKAVFRDAKRDEEVAYRQTSFQDKDVLESFFKSLTKSTMSQERLRQLGFQIGSNRSHTKVMTSSSKSRNQLQKFLPGPLTPLTSSA